MGSRRAAWRAGQTPNTTPTSEARRGRPPAKVVGVEGEAPAGELADDARRRPDRGRCRAGRRGATGSGPRRGTGRGCRGRARRSALRMPISRVRSRTDTSMMFMIPMPPTISEIEAMPPRRSVSVPLIDEAASSSCVWSKMSKSSSSVAARSCRSRSSAVIRALVVSMSADASHADADRPDAVAADKVLLGGGDGHEDLVVRILEARPALGLEDADDGESRCRRSMISLPMVIGVRGRGHRRSTCRGRRPAARDRR